MVLKEIKKTYGPYMGLNMALTNEPDFLCLDKTTQTSLEEKADHVSQEKKGGSYTLHILMPRKEKYYALKTEDMLQERDPAVKSEPGDTFPEDKQEQEELEKHMEGHPCPTLPADDQDLTELQQASEAAATVTSHILLAVASLRDADRNSIQAAAVMLNCILKKERHRLRGKVPEIIDIIYFHLSAIQEPYAREAAIGAVSLLVEKHTEEAVSSLLSLTLHCDRHITQIWETLGQARQPVRLQVLAKLLEVLKKRPCLNSELSGSELNIKNNVSLLPLAATKALCIIFKDKKCKVPMNSYYVSVIIFLVIQLHYLMNCSDTEYELENELKTSSYKSCTVEALKAVVKREKASHTCFTSLTGSWELLTSPETYLEGVLLLARALVKHHRGLDYAIFTKVIPLLHHGDEKQKLTAMAFFTALLSSESTYTALQKHYILGLLKDWQMNSSSTYRWLSLHGMGNITCYLQNKKELMALTHSILPSLNDPDEKVTLTALEVITKIVVRQKHSVSTSMHVKIVKHLHRLLADGRSKVSCVANRLFQTIIQNLDGREKSLMRDQVLSVVVTLLLNLQDPHPEVAQSRQDTLKECKLLLGWTTNENVDSLDLICKLLVKEHPGKLRSFLDQAQDYSQSPRKSSRVAATMFIDSILQHVETSSMHKTEVDFLRQAFSSSASEIQRAAPVVQEPEKVSRPEKVCKHCPDLFRCSRYFPSFVL